MGMQHNKVNIHWPNAEDPGYVHLCASRIPDTQAIEFKW